MKTIKGATGSKSVLLRKLALPFLMLVAILGIEIGGGQTAPRDPQSPIGPDIGGQAVPRHFTTIEIGGPGNQGAPRNDSSIGGIGGSQAAPRSYAVTEPIGGINGSEKRNAIKPYSPEPVAIAADETPDQQSAKNANSLGIPIGGNSCPRCGMSGIAIEIPPIGGGQTPPRPIDIGGGQLPPKSPLYLSSFLTDCTVDIGGNQGIPQAPLPIGGNGGGSTAPRNYKSII